VLAPDLLGLGEMGPGAFRGDASSFKLGSANYNYWFAAIQIGRSLTGIRAGDVVRIVNYLKGRADADVTRLAAVSAGAECRAPPRRGAGRVDQAGGRGGPAAVMVVDRAERVYAPKFVPHAVAGSLGRYDLADLASTLAPRKLLALGPVDEMGKPAPSNSIEAEFAPVRAAYAAIPGAPHALDVRPVRGEEELGPVLAAWFER